MILHPLVVMGLSLLAYIGLGAISRAFRPKKYLVRELKPGRSYVIFYTRESGLGKADMKQMGEGLRDCTVYMQPCLSLKGVKFQELP